MPSTSRLAAQTWLLLSEKTPERIRAVVARLIQQHKTTLATTFYTFMLDDAAARPFLSLAAVEARLKPGLQRWMEMLFCHSSQEELTAALAMH